MSKKKSSLSGLVSKRSKPKVSYTLSIPPSLLERINIVKANATIRGDRVNINNALINNLYDIILQIEKDYPTNIKTKVCAKCNSKMIVKTGPTGEFYACSSYPKCHHTININK